MNSNFFVALTTLAVGSLAYFVYRKQKIDAKKDAANIILLEIKDAETHLSQAKDAIMKDEYLPETIFAMRASNWDKYSYLFVRDFTAKEWDLINTFYEKCRLYDEALEYDNSFYKKNFDMAQQNLQITLASLALKHVEEIHEISAGNDVDDIKTVKLDKARRRHYKLLAEFADCFKEEARDPDGPYSYNSTKPLKDGRAIVSTVRLDLSTSTIGIKLDKIINQTFRSRLLERLVGSKTTNY